MVFNLGLRILGTGVRGGLDELFGHIAGGPPAAAEAMWDEFEAYEKRDFAAFRARGWNFKRQPEAPQLAFAIDGEKGLLTRHPGRGLVIVRDRLVVGLAKGVSAESLKDQYPDIKPLRFGTNVHEIPFKLPNADLDAAVAAERQRLQQIVGVEAVRFVDPVLVYNVEELPQPAPPPQALDDKAQWQWPKIKLADAWAFIHPKKGDDTRVAVIDQGFFESSQLTIERHVDEKGSPIQAPMKHVWHGTFCAALVGGTLNNHFGNGAAPHCRLILVAVGNEVTSVALADALKTSMDFGADVISCSVAPAGRSWDKLDTLLEAVDEVEQHGRGGRGTLVVWAVFNENRPIDPGSLEAHKSIVCVAPSDQDDVRAPASGFGEGLDLIAPGVAVPGLVGTDNTNAALSVDSGASFAAPGVAGVASLMLSVNPNLKATDLRQFLWDSADPVVPNKVRDDQIGWGRLNALQAVQKAKAAIPLVLNP